MRGLSLARATRASRSLASRENRMDFFRVCIEFSTLPSLPETIRQDQLALPFHNALCKYQIFNPMEEAPDRGP